jgi:hypothetical protein
MSLRVVLVGAYLICYFARDICSCCSTDMLGLKLLK